MKGLLFCPLVMLCLMASLVLITGSRASASRLPYNIEHELRKHQAKLR
jgi:hypothetical protein